MINSSESLPPVNRVWPSGFLALNIFVFTAVKVSQLGGAPFFVSWLMTHWASLLTLYLGMVLTLVIGNLVNWRWKAVLVFWDWSEPLPITRVFTRYLPKKPDTDPAAPGASTDLLPRNPTEQEDLWFRIFSKHKTHPAVTRMCDDFLLAQELTWLSFVVLTFFGAASLFTDNLSLQTSGYPAFLLIQYLVASILARSNGIRFLGNVLAVAQIHKFAGQIHNSASFSPR